MENIGVRAVIEGLSGYMSGLKDMQQATTDQTKALGDLQKAGVDASKSIVGMNGPVGSAMAALDKFQQETTDEVRELTSMSAAIGVSSKTFGDMKGPALSAADALEKFRAGTSDEVRELASMTGAIEKTKTPMEQFKASIQSQIDKLKEHATEIRNVGAAMLAMGAAGLKLSEDSLKVSSSIATVALETGLTEGQIKGLTSSLTSASFRVKEILPVLSLLGKAGVDSAEQLKSTATALDQLGQATGIEADQLTSTMIPVMQAFGKSITDVAEVSDMLTYMTHNSTISISDFSLRLPSVSSQLTALGLNMQDVIAALLALEAKGIKGRFALTALSQAATDAKDKGISFAEALGIDQITLDSYKTSLEGATGATDQYADAAEKQYGIIAKVGAEWDKLRLYLGPVLEPLNAIFGVMTALGTVLIALSLAIKANTFAWIAMQLALIPTRLGLLALNIEAGMAAVVMGIAAAATWAWNAALAVLNALLALPLLTIGLVILAIAALIAIIILVVKHWDTIAKAAKVAWDFVVSTVKKAIDFIKKYWEYFVAALAGPLGIAIVAIIKNWDKVKDAFKTVWDFIVKLWDESVGKLERFFDRLKDAAFVVRDALVEAFRWMRDKIVGSFEWVVNRIIDGINAVSRAINLINPFEDIPIIGHVDWTAPPEAQYGGEIRVGERGPEVVQLPVGSTVYPNNYNTTYNVNANYSRQQDPQSIGMDLEAIRMMSRA